MDGESKALRCGRWHALGTEWGHGSKLLGLVDIDALITLGLLSPEVEVESWVREVLLDLQDHIALSLHVKTQPGEDRIVVSVRLLRRGA
jgi:hypothetical protein